MIWRKKNRTKRDPYQFVFPSTFCVCLTTWNPCDSLVENSFKALLREQYSSFDASLWRLKFYSTQNFIVFSLDYNIFLVCILYILICLSCHQLVGVFLLAYIFWQADEVSSHLVSYTRLYFFFLRAKSFQHWGQCFLSLATLGQEKWLKPYFGVKPRINVKNSRTNELGSQPSSTLGSQVAMFSNFQANCTHIWIIGRFP